MYETPRKTVFIGFIVIYQEPSSHARLQGQMCISYLLTYKPRSPWAVLLCSIYRRAAGGTNNNPTSTQFTTSYRRLLIRHEVQGQGGNCVAHQEKTDVTKTVTVSSEEQNMF